MAPYTKSEKILSVDKVRKIVVLMNSKKIETNGRVLTKDIIGEAR